MSSATSRRNLAHGTIPTCDLTWELLEVTDLVTGVISSNAGQKQDANMVAGPPGSRCRHAILVLLRQVANRASGVESPEAENLEWACPRRKLLVKARTGSHRPPTSSSRAHLASFRCLAQNCHGHVKPAHVRAVCNPGTTSHAAVLRLLRVRGHGDELEPSSEPRGIMVQRAPKQELTALQSRHLDSNCVR